MVKRKILFVNGHLNVGGIEKSLVDLLRWLDYSKYDVDLLLLEGKGDYLEQLPPNVNIIFKDIRKAYGSFLHVFLQNLIHFRFNIIYYRIVLLISSYLGKEFLRYWNLFFLLPRNYDCAIAYRPGICADVVAYVVKSRKKICWWHHGECLYSPKQIRESNTVWKSFNNIVTVSNGCKSMIESTFDYPPSKIVVIPNLIDIDRITLLAGEKSPYVFNSKVINIVTVGRLSPEKHIEDIPQIASELIDRGISQFKWYVVGEGDMRNQIEDKIKKYNVEKYITLLGAKTNPYPYIKYADLMVHTSHVESQGLTILEAMALKTPCVVVASLGPKDYIIDGDNAFIVEGENKKLVDRISKILKSIPDVSIVNKAFNTVLIGFSPKTICKKIQNII